MKMYLIYTGRIYDDGKPSVVASNRHAAEVWLDLYGYKRTNPQKPDHWTKVDESGYAWAEIKEIEHVV